MVNIINVPGSISSCIYYTKMKHNWKSSNKISYYNIKNIKTSLRFSSPAMLKLLNLEKEYCKVDLKFFKKDRGWIINLHRSKNGVSCYIQNSEKKRNRARVQISLNGYLPEELKKFIKNKFENKKSAGFSIPVLIQFTLNEWKDVNLKPWDFINAQEKEAKSLMSVAFSKGFYANYISKGNAYDLNLISQNKKEYIIALSSYNMTDKKRNKERRKQKILMDIAKIVPILFKTPKVIPIIISQPIEFKGSWSYTTNSYLEFYKKNFNFKFLTTDFKRGWENKICNEILDIDKNSKLFKSRIRTLI